MLVRDVATRVRVRVLSEVWRSMGRVTPEYTVATRQGRFRVLTSDAVIGRILFAAGEYEEQLVHDTVALLERLGRPVRGGTLLDVGGNMGITTVTMLAGGLMERAIAIEPDPTNFRLLEHNVELNGLRSRVTSLNIASSDAPGVVELALNTWNPADHRVRVAGQAGREASDRAVVSVPAETLDATIKEPISLIWADVQGHEAHVIRGADRLLRSGVPTMLEVWPYGLAQAGTSREEFCELARRYWKQYWTPRQLGMVRYPIEALESIWEEHPGPDSCANALFM